MDQESASAVKGLNTPRAAAIAGIVFSVLSIIVELYLAMFFASAALAGGLLLVLGSGTETVIQSGAYAVSRAQIFQIMNIYAIKMAGVFMLTVSTISLHTRIVPRWMTFLSYIMAVLLVFTVGKIEWIPIVFPLWVLMMSLCILIERFRVPAQG